MLNLNLLSLTLGCGLVLLGCAGTSGHGPGSARGSLFTPAGIPSSLPLTSEEAADLTFMREEEKLARDVYATLAQHWRGIAGAEALAVALENITPSEQQHMDRLKDFLAPAGLPDPVVAGEAVGAFTNPDLASLYGQLVAQGKASVEAGLQVGALIEEKDLADLAAALGRCQQASLRTAYEGLACGSRNHLRAFTAPLRANGTPYVAQVLPQAEVDAILASASGPCGGR